MAPEAQLGDSYDKLSLSLSLFLSRLFFMGRGGGGGKAVFGEMPMSMHSVLEGSWGLSE